MGDFGAKSSHRSVMMVAPRTALKAKPWVVHLPYEGLLLLGTAERGAIRGSIWGIVNPAVAEIRGLGQRRRPNDQPRMLLVWLLVAGDKMRNRPSSRSCQSWQNQPEKDGAPGLKAQRATRLVSEANGGMRYAVRKADGGSPACSGNPPLPLTAELSVSNRSDVRPFAPLVFVIGCQHTTTRSSRRK